MLVSGAVPRGLVPRTRHAKYGSLAHRATTSQRSSPTQDEIKILLDKAEGITRTLVHVAIFTGMRASELRGLTWPDVDLKEQVIPRPPTR